MSKIIQGNFSNLAEAEVAADKLIASGYPKESICLVVDKSQHPDIQEKTDLPVETTFSLNDGETEESLWERIKDFFGGEEQDTFKDKVQQYQDELASGNILVVYDEELVENAPTTIPTIDEEDMPKRTEQATTQQNDLDHPERIDIDADNADTPLVDTPPKEGKIAPDLTKRMDDKNHI